MTNNDLPADLRFEEIATFLSVYDRARNARPLQYPTFRDLFHGLGAHTTTLGHINRLLDAIFPVDAAGVPAQSGERLKLLFAERPGVGLEPTPLADRLRTRFEPLRAYWKSLRASALVLATNRNGGDAIVRIGAPQTLTLRILAYACSYTVGIFEGATNAEGGHKSVRLDITAGDTERDLLPQLHLGMLDCIVGYGLPQDDPSLVAYTDPDNLTINFADLGCDFDMVLIYHPTDRKALFPDHAGSSGDTRKRKVKKSAGSFRPSINPANIDLRRLTLIAVPSWRQCEPVQDLIERARRLNNLKEVVTDDEALALVRCGCGVAIVPEVFRDRRVVKYVALEPARDYKRKFGIYYSHHRGLTPNTCRFAEFLREYMTIYKIAKDRAYRDHPGKEFKPPACDEDTKAGSMVLNEVRRRLKDKYGPAPNWETIAQVQYPCTIQDYRAPIRGTKK